MRTAIVGIGIMLHIGLDGHDYIDEEPIFQGNMQESLGGRCWLHPLHEYSYMILTVLSY